MAMKKKERKNIIKNHSTQGSMEGSVRTSAYAYVYVCVCINASL